MPGGTLTPHLHLGPRLRMTRAIPLLPLCAFMAWTGSTLVSFHVSFYQRSILIHLSSQRCTIGPLEVAIYTGTQSHPATRDYKTNEKVISLLNTFTLLSAACPDRNATARSHLARLIPDQFHCRLKKLNLSSLVMQIKADRRFIVLVIEPDHFATK